MSDKLTEALAKSIKAVDATARRGSMLREALEWYDETRTSDPVLAEAARRWRDFPTDADVKRAMAAQRVVDDRIANGESGEGEYEAMAAALEAVKREDR